MLKISKDLIPFEIKKIDIIMILTSYISFIPFLLPFLNIFHDIPLKIELRYPKSSKE